MTAPWTRPCERVRKYGDASAATGRARSEHDDAVMAAGRARAECDDAVAQNALLTKHLAVLREGAKHLRALDGAHRDAMRDLVGRGKALCERFGVELQVPDAY